MAEEPHIRHNRFEGYSLEQKYSWMQDRSGVETVRGLADQLAELHVVAEQCNQRVAEAMKAVSGGWHGRAAAEMLGAALPSARWAQEAVEAAKAMEQAAAKLEVDFAEARPKVEPEEPIRQPGIGEQALAGFNPMAMIMIQQDMQAQVAANKARDDAANRALYAYENATRSVVEGLPRLADPPPIAVESRPPGPPPLPPGDRDRDRDRREPPPVIDPPPRDGREPGRVQPPGGAVDPGRPGEEPGQATTPVQTTTPSGVGAERPGGGPGAPGVPGAGGVAGGGAGTGGGSGFGAGTVGGYGVGARGGAGGVAQPPGGRSPGAVGGTAARPGAAGAAGKPGVPGHPGYPPPVAPGAQRGEDREHTSKVRKLSDEIYGLDDLPTVPPPVIGEAPPP